MDRHDVADLLFNLLEAEGAKQEKVVFLSMSDGVISIVDDKDQTWNISIKQDNKCKSCHIHNAPYGKDVCTVCEEDAW